MGHEQATHPWRSTAASPQLPDITAERRDARFGPGAAVSTGSRARTPIGFPNDTSRGLKMRRREFIRRARRRRGVAADGERAQQPVSAGDRRTLNGKLRSFGTPPFSPAGVPQGAVSESGYNRRPGRLSIEYRLGARGRLTEASAGAGAETWSSRRASQ